VRVYYRPSRCNISSRASFCTTTRVAFVFGESSKSDEATRRIVFAADRAGVDQGLRHFPPSEVETDVQQTLRLLSGSQEADTHPDVEKRCEAVSARIQERLATQAAGPPQPPLKFGIFNSPIFDELEKMAGEMLKP
jgi:hypothetical protein